MKIKNDITSAIVKVVCGATQGTAFFVSPTQLLTAFHVVADSLNGEKVYVLWGNRSIECSVRYKKPLDIALLTLSEAPDAPYLELLPMSVKEEQHLLMFGFPDTRIGQSA